MAKKSGKGAATLPAKVEEQKRTQAELEAVAARDAAEGREAVQAARTEQAPAEAGAQGSLFDLTEYEKELAAVRDKYRLAVDKRIAELQAQRRTIDEELNKLNAVDAHIEGRRTRTAASTGNATASTGGTRFRPSDEEKAQAAEVIGVKFQKQWGKKNEVARKDIIDVLGERWKNHVGKVVDAWNETHKGEPIGTNGLAKSKARYVMN